MCGSGAVVLFRTKEVFNSIFLFWVLCALEVQCVSPITKVHCDLKKLSRGEYAGEY